MKKNLLALLALILCGLSTFSQTSGKMAKLTSDEIVAKHIASIGTPEAIAAAKSRVMVGEGSLKMKLGGIGHGGGPAQIASQNNMFLLVIILSAINYPYEKVGFDGKNLTVGRPEGRRTELAEFLKSHTGIVKDGLFGGVYSAAWPFLPNVAKKPKMSASVVETGGKQFHKLEFSPSGGNVRAVLTFDANTFQHVMSEYTYSIAPRISRVGNSSQKPNYYTLTERFSDFAKAGDLVLPMNYTIDYSSSEDEGANWSQWNIRTKQVYYNEVLDASVFKVS
jgi:hypothetical protein